MGSPAARLEDSTEHGGMIIYGTPTTLIGGMPASRLFDMHECPQVTGVVPHVGGPILFGSINVWVGGSPQARISDLCFCVGPPDLVASGHEETLVGMDGFFAGGIGGFLSLLAGALLAGLHNLLNGYPRAVADPNEPDGYYTQYSKSIAIRGTAEFQRRVISDLNMISSTNTGTKTIEQIDESKHTLTIKESQVKYHTIYTSPLDRYRTSAGGPKGVGTDSTIEYPATPVVVYGGVDPWMHIPSDVGLLHEMRHAADATNGVMDNGTSPINSMTVRNAEAQATGIGPYAGDPLTENSYRLERVPPEPLRTRY